MSTKYFDGSTKMSAEDDRKTSIADEKMDGEGKTLDDLIEDIGGMGRFQVYLILGVCSSYMALGWTLMISSYSVADTHWYCSMDVLRGDSLNYIGETLRRHSNIENSEALLGGSSIRNNTGSCILLHGNRSYEACSMDGRSCDSFCFDGQDNTVVTEWNLVCDKKWQRQLISSLQMAGVLVGSLIFGQLSDSFGRKKSYYSSVLLHMLVNIVAGFSVSTEMYAVSLFFLGVAIGGFLTVVYPYNMEFLPPVWRPFVATQPFNAIGTSLLALMAYLLKDWRYPHFAVAIFTSLFLPGWLYFPESVRWLAVHHKQDKAMAAIDKIARTNKREVPEYTARVLNSVDLLERKAGVGVKKYTYIDLFRTWKIALTTLGVGFIWIMINICFYGLGLGVSGLGGNLYLNIFLMALVDVPASGSMFFSMNKIGRRYSGLLCLGLTTLISVALLVVQMTISGSSKETTITVLALAAKMTSAGAFGVIYMWGTELYPTVVRNLAFGMSSMFGRVGGVVAPFTIDLTSNGQMSFIIMASGMLVSTLIAFVLPETKGVPLPDTFNMEIEVESEEKTFLLTDSGKEVVKYDREKENGV